MTEGVIVAIIGCFATMFGAILTFIIQIKKLRNDQKVHSDEMKEEQQKQFNELKTNVATQINGLHDSIKDIKSEYEKSTALTTEKLSQLEKKQDKHNQLIERMYRVETDVEVLKNRESVSEHRIEDLEGGYK